MTESTSLNKKLKTAHIIWNLNDLYTAADDPSLLADISWCKEEGGELSSRYKGKVGSLSAMEIFQFVTRLEVLQTRIGKLATYSFLNFTTQIDNSAAGALYQKIRELSSRIDAELVFFDLEWNSLSTEYVNDLFLQSALLPYRHFLLSMRRYQPHLLSEAEETLLIERRIVGRSSWTTLFEKVIGYIRFGKKQRTEEEVLTDLYNKKRSIRMQAAQDMTDGLRSQNHILTHIFNTLAAEKMVTDRQRKHTSWISSMNLDNQLQDATVNALVEAVTGRYDIVQRYYQIKKNVLGLDELFDYDRYAPLPGLPAKQYTWPESKAIVLRSFSQFSPQMADIAELFFQKKYIHAPVLRGKRGGAFAHPCVPQVHPYVMVNFTGSIRDISTVAHELGHGIHQVLAAEKGYFYSDTPLVLAETASVFAELLVFTAQLELLENATEKTAFICQKLESIFATVFRQTAMNRFETAMHEGRRKEGELSSDRLSELWLETQRQMFGDAVTLTPDYGIWWSYIPHFLSTPGYVYSYAFGELLVLSLYGLYKEEGHSFIEKYFTLLKAGGSDTPYQLLKPFAINLDDTSFWNNGLDLIDTMLRQVEQ